MLATEISTLYPDNAQSEAKYYGSETYYSLKLIYDIFSYVVLFLRVIGGIIFFSSMVNLFNSIVHSVDTRKNYLGVMRAVGAKSKIIPRLYLAESLTIFARASIWIIIFAGVLCAGIKIGLDFAFKFINDEMAFLTYKIGISAWYIPVVIVGALLLLVIIGAVFSFGCSRRVSKKPIMEVLND